MSEQIQPLIPASQHLPEITFKAIILSIFLAIILAASNTYLALKIGTTISASIPAAVVAIGVLRLFRRHNVLECNIVQTAASSGEAVAAAASFVLPCFIIIHFWMSFDYWITTVAVGMGGLLGVAFSVPLRKVLLNMPLLRFPEGVAVGETLCVSTQGGNLLSTLLKGVGVSAVITVFQSGFEIISNSFGMWRLTAAGTLFGMDFGCGTAALAAGYIIGIRVSIALLVGVIVGWAIGIPILGHVYGVPAAASAYDSAMMLWSHKLRYVGVGVMLIGGIWTLFRLAGPVAKGIIQAWSSLFASMKGKKINIPRTERDLSLIWVAVAAVVITVIFYFVLMRMLTSLGISSNHDLIVTMVLCSLAYLLIAGFLLCTMCGYFAGLIGSTNNPLSGLLIMGVLLLGLIFSIFFATSANHLDPTKLVALVILITVIIGSIASMSNDCLQDLKAGQIVGSTPWKQQFMLVIGVIAAAAVVAPVLELLYQAYGMGGVFPHAGMPTNQMLPAPQAMLLASVAQGVITHNLDWAMILSGVAVGAVGIIVDEILTRFGYRLPVLAIGLGIYLPPELMLPIVIGGFISAAVKRKTRDVPLEKRQDGEQRAMLLACGIVAGSSLMGVLLAIPFVLKGSANALALVPAGFEPIANVLGVLVVIALCYWMYSTAVKLKKS